MVVVAGCGALGSQIALHLAHPDREFVLIDDDRVGEENIGTSGFDRHQVGMMKVVALAELLWLRNCVETEIVTRTVDEKLDYGGLIVDSFDNSEARSYTCGLNTVHVGVSEARTGIVLWDSIYTLPTEHFERGENPVCTHLLGSKILRLTAAIAANIIEDEAKINAIVTEKGVRCFE